MTLDEYLKLFEKYLEGHANAEEIALLMRYQDQFEFSEGSDISVSDLNAKNRILKQLNLSVKERNRKLTLFGFIKVAVAVAVAMSAGLLLYPGLLKSPQKTAAAKPVKQWFAPHQGADKALLTLADGKQVVLNDLKVGTTLRHRNIKLQKQRNGMMQFTIAPDAKTLTDTQLNTITTPIGGQYQILLPDGSRVWLNAASTLKFPTRFAHAERLVELEGEGYFEVAKNKKLPFKVKYGTQQVEVLGTHFNIQAYAADAQTNATLLEGSVRIVQGNKARLLTPGEQATYVRGDKELTIQQVDVEQVIAWRNGLFVFKNLSIQAIMAQIARWYNIEVVYQGKIKNQEFGGRISRSKSLSEILKNLELTGTVHFKMQGRRVTVME